MFKGSVWVEAYIINTCTYRAGGRSEESIEFLIGNNRSPIK